VVERPHADEHRVRADALGGLLRQVGDLQAVLIRPRGVAQDELQQRMIGPRPQSKETALMMLADGCEAKARSDRPRTEDDLHRIVKAVIDDRVAKGQLDDTGLTLRDLQIIRESFVNTLKGMFHPRLEYPEEKPGSGEPSSAIGGH